MQANWWEEVTATTVTSEWWPYWTSTQAATTTSAIWTNWQSVASNNSQVSAYLQGARQQWQHVEQTPPRVKTAAEIAEEDARIARYRETERATQRRLAEALERSEGLLLRYLTWAQRREYKKHRHVTVRSQTGRKFRLRGDHASGNIILLNEAGEGVQRYCAHPRDVPMPDVLISQMMHLRHNEAEFLARANRH